MENFVVVDIDEKKNMDQDSRKHPQRSSPEKSFIRHPSPVPRTSGYSTSKDFEERLGLTLRYVTRDRCADLKLFLVLAAFFFLTAFLLFVFNDQYVMKRGTGEGNSGIGLMFVVFVGLLGSVVGLAVTMYQVCTRSTSRGAQCGLLFCREEPLRVRKVMDAYNNDGYIDIDV